MRFISLTRFHKPNTSQEHASNFWRQQEGIAALIAITALSVFSLLGLYLSLNATTEVRISENYESHQQADLAARAGLNHARELIRGLQLNDLLQGPKAIDDPSKYPSTRSLQYAFRNWMDWSTARSLNILDPASDLTGLSSDDLGLINTGKYGGADGTPLVPRTGIALTAPDPDGSGTVTTARYFLKVTDNPEDCDTDPFTDCDGIVIVRSTGVARTIRETGGPVRANSVAVYEAKFKELRTFDLDAPVVVEGDGVLPAAATMFTGSSFNIDGSPNPYSIGTLYGIGTIDTNTSNTIHPADQIKARLSPERFRNIKGKCCGPTQPAIGDITTTVGLNPDKRLLLDPNFLGNIAYNLMPKFADNVYQGNQSWPAGTAVDLGYYDPSEPLDAPSQRFKITYVNGDLSVSGNFSGAGVLLVTGKLSISGSLRWSGLILVIGQGYVDTTGGMAAVEGGLYVVNLQSGNPPFGTPKITISGSSSFKLDDKALLMAIRSLPQVELSRREVTSLIDP